MGTQVDSTHGITQKTAEVLNTAQGQTRGDIKKAVSEQLQTMLKNGEITPEEAKEAKKFLDHNLASALARKNTVEGNKVSPDLPDKKADALMKSSGLTVEDLYEASKFAGVDYNVNYTKLSKEEKATAENGELTASELKNIQNALNEKIKANGGEKTLTDKETKLLMKGLGLSVEKKFNIPKIIMAALGMSEAGGLTGVLTSTGAKTVVNTTTTVVNGASVTASATAHTGASGIGLTSGLAAGALIGAGAEILHQANRKEKAYGEQGGVEGGHGSVTNKTEAKMHQIETAANPASGETKSADELPPLPSQPAENETISSSKTDSTMEQMPDGSIVVRENGKFVSRYKEVEEGETGETETHYMNEAGKTIAVEKPVDNGEKISYKYYDGEGKEISGDEYWKIIEESQK